MSTRLCLINRHCCRGVTFSRKFVSSAKVDGVLGPIKWAEFYEVLFVARQHEISLITGVLKPSVKYCFEERTHRQAKQRHKRLHGCRHSSLSSLVRLVRDVPVIISTLSILRHI